MPISFHLSFIGRKVRIVGDVIEYLDGLPAPTEAELDATRDDAEAAWLEAQSPVKIWPDAERFVAEFTLAEMASIDLSSDTTIAALRFMLSTWHSPVHANDPRVITGLDALVSNGIISAERKAEILT